jgi:NAD(P)-dependent dehydrogenase (short-subunit alcohol dehydrogenase family)
MARFTGKTAVVTGSGRRGGLGEAIVRRLASEGAAVVLSDIGASRDAATPGSMIGENAEMEALAAELRAESGSPISAFVCDVRDYDQVTRMADHAVQTHGPLDIWVNNAGIGYIMKPLLEVTPADWNAVIGVNLTGAFFGLRAAAEIMVAHKKGGRIINIASQAAKSALPTHRPTPPPNTASWASCARRPSSLGRTGSPSTMSAPTMSRRASAHGRTSISPRSSAQRRWTTIWLR